MHLLGANLSDLEMVKFVKAFYLSDILNLLYF